MRHVAVIGRAGRLLQRRGAAEALWRPGPDRHDRPDPVPYGLIRFGVAPDHQSIKAVCKRYEKVADSADVRFVGNVLVGRDVSIAELLELYDAVILATGAPHDRPLGIPGEDLPGVVGSAAFVGWYNGHPEFADLDPPLDGRRGGDRQRQCRARRRPHPRQDAGRVRRLGHRRPRARRARQSAIRTITMLGRRGPHQIAMTPKELGELGHLEDAVPGVDPADFPPVEADDACSSPGMRKSVTHLRDFADAADADKPKTIVFDFFAKPVRIEGDGKVERLIVERTGLDESGAALGTGETYEVPAAWSSAASATRPRRSRACPMRSAAASPMTTGVIGDGLYASAGRGAGRPGRSAPTGPTAMRSPSRSPPRCRRAARGDRAGARGARSACSTSAASCPPTTRLARIEATESGRARAGSPAREVRPRRGLAATTLGPLTARLRFPEPPSI